MKKILFSSVFVASIALAGNIEVSDAYFKATPPNAKNSAAFMKIKNNSNQDIALIGGTNNLSEFTEFHTHVKEDGMMKMIKVEKIIVPAKGSAELKPGDLHVMLIGLKNPVKVGDKVNLTLDFDNGEKIELKNLIAKEIKPMHKMNMQEMNSSKNMK